MRDFEKMIRITKLSKLSKRKNPHLEDIEDFIEENSFKFKYLNKGVEGKAYYFKTNKRLILNTEILQPGEYVLKVFNEGKNYSSTQINQLKLFSKYGLIPKVFIVTKKYVIMKYIKGFTLYSLYDTLNNDSQLSEIENKVAKLEKIWKKLGFEKYLDISNDENILVSEDLKHVYFIDPFLDDVYNLSNLFKRKNF